MAAGMAVATAALYSLAHARPLRKAQCHGLVAVHEETWSQVSIPGDGGGVEGHGIGCDSYHRQVYLYGEETHSDVWPIHWVARTRTESSFPLLWCSVGWLLIESTTRIDHKHGRLSTGKDLQICECPAHSCPAIR